MQERTWWTTSPPLHDSLRLIFQSSSCQSPFGSKTAGSIICVLSLYVSHDTEIEDSYFNSRVNDKERQQNLRHVQLQLSVLCLIKCLFFFCRWSTWPAMPKTTWCLIFTLIAWTRLSRRLETGTATSADSWRETVCLKYNIKIVFLLVILRTVLKWFHLLFCGLSGIWIVVRPCERLVEEERELSKYPLHVLRRSGWGNLVVIVGLFLFRPLNLS